MVRRFATPHQTPATNTNTRTTDQTSHNTSTSQITHVPIAKYGANTVPHITQNTPSNDEIKIHTLHTYIDNLSPDMPSMKCPEQYKSKTGQAIALKQYTFDIITYMKHQHEHGKILTHIIFTGLIELLRMTACTSTTADKPTNASVLKLETHSNINADLETYAQAILHKLRSKNIEAFDASKKD